MTIYDKKDKNQKFFQDSILYLPKDKGDGESILTSTIARKDSECQSVIQKKSDKTMCATQEPLVLTQHEIGAPALSCSSYKAGYLYIYGLFSGFGQRDTELHYLFIPPYADWINEQLHKTVRFNLDFWGTLI